MAYLKWQLLLSDNPRLKFWPADASACGLWRHLGRRALVDLSGVVDGVGGLVVTSTACGRNCTIDNGAIRGAVRDLNRSVGCFGLGHVAKQRLYLKLQPIQRWARDHEQDPAQRARGATSKHNEPNDAQQAKDQNAASDRGRGVKCAANAESEHATGRTQIIGVVDAGAPADHMK